MDDSNSPRRMAESQGADFERQSARVVWTDVRSSLKKSIKGVAYHKWIDRLDLVAEVDGEVLLAAMDGLQAQRIESDYINIIKAAWLAHDGKQRRVVVKARSDIDPSILELAETRDSADRPRPHAFRTRMEARGRNTLGAHNALRKNTLDTLVVGQANHVMASIVGKIVEGGEPPAGIITLYGLHGVGKSHHLQALAHALTAQGRGHEVIYITAQEFLTAYLSGVKSKDTSNLRDRVRKARFVLFDDLHVICGKRGTEQEFWETLREVTACNDDGPTGFVFVAADGPPSEIAGLSARIRSELQGGMLVELEKPDAAMMRDIVARKTELIRAQDPEFELTESMVDRIIYAVDDGPRILTGILVSTYSESAYVNRPVTDEIVDRAILRHVGRTAVPTVEEIKKAVAEVTGVSRSVMESKSRFAPHCRARHLAFYLAREKTTKSLPQIGNLIGGRHHTTVMHGYRKINDTLADTSSDTAAERDELKRQIDAILAVLKDIIAGRARPGG